MDGFLEHSIIETTMREKLIRESYLLFLAGAGLVTIGCGLAFGFPGLLIGIGIAMLFFALETAINCRLSA